MAAAGKAPRKKSTVPTGEIVTNGISTLSNNFYGTLQSLDNTHKKYANVIYSPFSLSSCFAMLKVGTRGETAQELQRGLTYPAGDDALCTGYQKILKNLPSAHDSKKQNSKTRTVDFTLVSANRMYIEEKFKIKKSYEQTLGKHFGGEKVARLKMNKAAAGEINKWVENTTQGTIKNLVDPVSFEKYPPKLVLINAVYFKAEWEDGFKFMKTHTKPKDFFLSEDPKDKISVLMMHNTGFMDEGINLAVTYLKEIDADVIVFPYKGERFVMLIYLPKKKSGLKKIQQNIRSVPKISTILDAMKYGLYEFSLPRFKIESDFDLVPILTKMGVTGIFKATGDFRGMVESNEEELLVSQAVQKAVIAVDENGTEAAAATFLGWGGGGGPTEIKIPPRITVDRPFYFQIVDKQEHLVLFAGSCSRPILATKENLKALEDEIDHDYDEDEENFIG